MRVDAARSAFLEAVKKARTRGIEHPWESAENTSIATLEEALPDMTPDVQEEIKKVRAEVQEEVKKQMASGETCLITSCDSGPQTS